MSRLLVTTLLAAVFVIGTTAPVAGTSDAGTVQATESQVMPVQEMGTVEISITVLADDPTEELLCDKLAPEVCKY